MSASPEVGYGFADADDSYVESGALDGAGFDGPDVGDGDFGGGGGGGGVRRFGRRVRRRFVLIAVALIVLLAAAAIWLVAFSSVFGVRTVTVRGTHVTSAAQVRAAAKVVIGTPVVRVDTNAIRQRVERLAVVARAEVSTSFPHTVTITVVERQPVGYVRSAGKVELIDRAGLRYRTVPAAPHGLPRLVLPSGRSAASRSVARVAAALPASLRARLKSIQALDPVAITLVLRDGQLVQWGSATRNVAKARVLAPLLRHQVAQVDVSDPDLPFTR
ncbi:cell division protein FtsQ/DivIB [uncultured Jatrophihabitans sp.]|uniref:cell division protein FtsQ/DivIB n=1 Tax=uncultured Jatrophihabitans sp. TaxID=1610747 RepID=UPI0035CA8090